MNVPFWEELYKDDNVSAFGTQPNDFLQEFLNLIDKNGNILDVGCGDGKNSLYPASLGYLNVDAFDISENAVNKLKRTAERIGVNVNAQVCDLANYFFNKKYDLIMSFGTLHFTEKASWRKFLADAKENTNIGGIHIIQLFTNKVPASPDISPYAVGLADESEIKEIYRDWKILQFKAYVFEDEHPGVPKHLHAANKIVARRV